MIFNPWATRRDVGLATCWGAGLTLVSDEKRHRLSREWEVD
jgi:hypothetical protein